MFCAACGSNLKPDANFCTSCGFKKVSQNVKPVSASIQGVPPIHLTYTGYSVTGTVLSIIGYVGGVISLVFVLSLAITFVTSPYGSEYLSALIFFSVFLAISILLIIINIIIKRRIKRLKHYFSLISGLKMTSLRDIAASINRSEEFVYKDLHKMIRSNLLNRAAIDYRTREIILI